MKSLNELQWKEFEIGDFFKVYTGGDLIINTVKEGHIPVVSHSMLNNGIATFSEKILGRKLFNSNTTISLADRGNFYAFVQHTDFYIGTRVKALEATFKNCNKTILKFICPLINAQAVRFSYGNNCCGKTDSLKIILPINHDEIPDWQFMEGYIKNKEQELKQKYRNNIVIRLKNLKKFTNEEKKWREFEIRKIFSINPGKRLTKADMKEGQMPFVGATDSNNGITEYVSNTNSSLDKNVLGVNYNGSVGETFYHPYHCIFSDDVKRFSLKEIEGNKYLYLYFKAVILKQKCKYEYGYKFNEKRMQKQKILLPINKKGEPDYEYMENYMKYLEQQKLLKYIQNTDIACKNSH